MESRQAATVPIHCTAGGKAVLALSEPALIDRVIATGLKPVTAQTITDPAEFRSELARVKVRGFAVDDREFEGSIRAVGAAIVGPAGTVLGAITAGQLARSMPPIELRRTAQAVMKAAGAISEAMGAIGAATSTLKGRGPWPPRPTRSI
jgi:DNA-binding IclR family transcriptional regulator